MPPTPIGLLITLVDPVESAIFAVVLSYPHTIGAIFVAIPMMIVIMILVVVHPIVGLQHCGG